MKLWGIYPKNFAKHLHSSENRDINEFALVAQLVERGPEEPRVGGSIPSQGTTDLAKRINSQLVIGGSWEDHLASIKQNFARLLAVSNREW